MSDPSPPRLLPMLAGGSGVPADPSAHQMEPKFDGRRELAASTIDRRLSTVCGFYRFAHIDGRIASNPAQ